MSPANSADGDLTDAKITVFVVDDEPMLLDLASTVLENAGFSVRVFRDPQQALFEFANTKPEPDVLVTDYAMGAMNGMDLIRECRRIKPEQKIILISGTVDRSIYSNSPVKPDRFLAKPYPIDDFVQAIQSLAAEKR